MNLSQKYKIILLITYFILCIITNLFYKNYLFEKSLIIAKNFQSIFSSQFSKAFFLLITQFGSQVFYIPVFLIYFILNPLNYFIYIITTLILSIYTDCLMKIIYNDPRPFFINSELFQECEGGFGNPSGHSFGAAATYLGIWHLSMRYKKFKNNNKVIYGSLIFTIIFIFIIMISRIYRGVHSIDQIIYGGLLGLGFYYLMFFIVDIYKLKPKEFFEKIDKDKYIFISIFCFLIILIFPFYFIFNKYDDKIDSYNKILNEKCKIEEYLKYYNNGVVGCLLVIILLAIYLGLIFLKKKCEKNIIDYEYKLLNLNKSNLKTNLIRSVIFLLFSFPFILFILIKSNNLFIIFFFKIGLSFFFGSFSMFGLGIYFGFYLINKYNTNENVKNNISIDSSIDREISQYSTVNASPPEKFSIVEIQY